MEVDELAKLVEKGLADLSKRMDARFDKVDQRFEEIDERFERVDQRFDGIENRLDRLERRADTFNDRQADMKGQIAMVILRLNGIDNKLLRLDGRVAGLEKEFKGIPIVVEGLHQSIKFWAEGLDTLRERLDRHTAASDQKHEEIESTIRNFRR